MNYIGQTIKKIREEKGFLVKEIYSNILSRTTAFRFERDETEVTFDQLLIILKRINISDIQEFIFLRELYFGISEPHSEFEKIMNIIEDNVETQPSIDFYNKYKDSKSTRERFHAYVIHIEYLVNRRSRTNNEATNLLPVEFKVEYDYVRDYLMQSNSWTLDELDLFPFLSFAFEPEVREILFEKFIKNYQRYRNYTDKDWFNSYLNNLLNFCLIDIQLETFNSLIKHMLLIDALMLEKHTITVKNQVRVLILQIVRATYENHIVAANEIRTDLETILSIQIYTNQVSTFFFKLLDTYVDLAKKHAK